MKEGDSLSVIGPLGNGFPYEKARGRKVLLFFLVRLADADGSWKQLAPIIRVHRHKLSRPRAPCSVRLELARRMECERKQIVVGYRDRNTFLEESFRQNGEVYISTEDGSAGTKGNVMDAVRENGLCTEMIFACGPAPMLRAIQQYAKEREIESSVWPAPA